MQKPKRRFKIPKILLGCVAALMVLVSLIAVVVAPLGSSAFAQTLNVFLGHTDFKIENSTNEQYFTSDFTSTEALVAYEEEICEQIVAEGMVLLQNNGALPLAETAKVSIFGQNSVDMVYGGVGAGSVDASTAARINTSFENVGLQINKTLWDFYETGAGSAYRKQVPNVLGMGLFVANEVPQSVYTDDVKASYAEYSDAAVVIFGRSGGESADLSFDTQNENGAHYLELSQEERELLDAVCNQFETVVVLINSSNPVELGFLDEFAIDACVWIGAMGQTGANAVADMLVGNVNPSGALVDTYAYDALSAPAMENFGDYTITNSDVASGNKYMVYAEGIYVGYKYYETRYEDVVLGTEPAANYDYSKTVQFPFGYGLSYTDFAWSAYAVRETANTFEVSLTVTNTGKAAGKDIVQVYLQAPYTAYDKQNNIEKPSVALVGFAKTDDLQSGASQTLTISVDKEEMRAYDADGFGTYIVDAGDYYLSAADNAHTALNNILAAKGKTTADGMDANGDESFVYQYTQQELDATNYATAENGTAITNQFDNADLRLYDPDFVYLSRSDWSGTWPATYQNGSWNAPAQLLADLEISTQLGGGTANPATGTISDTYGKLNAVDMIGVPYDDPMWDAFLAQISTADLYEHIRMGGYAMNPILEVNLPGTLSKDGPAGISSTLMGGVSCMAYPPEIVLASTWNLDLIEEMGRLIGEDSLYSGVAMWYAPAMNTHRTAFSGRNFEYYSEDAFLSGKMGAAETRGAVEKGVIVTLKHYALNDQETNRTGVATFANEQSLRQNHLRAFETSVREGGANGVMNSMNRIGARWSGGHYGLMTGTLRNEWGFVGVAITDQTSMPNFAYCDIYEGLEAGTDLWLNVATFMWTPDSEKLTPDVEQQVQTAAKNVLYATVNSNAMNGMSADAQVKSATPTWKYWRVAIMILLVLWLCMWVLITKRLWFGPSKKQWAKIEAKRAAKLAKKQG